MTATHVGVERRKRLGQFFTPHPVAALLLALAGPEPGARVCDPMAGSGAMLLAALPFAPGSLSGAEIDPAAHAVCTSRVPGADVVRGDAFSHEWTTGFDLVVTNPPYVRYQSGAAASSGIPSAREVRTRLVERLESLDGAGPFLDVARTYSGLADLAVPSWVLCAALTRPGGTLAMVMPEAWLSRNYAAPIHRLLASAFDVRCVVDDAHGTWFETALVRTSLVVARRRSPGRSPARRVRLRRDAASATSLVGGTYPSSPHPEREFARDLHAGRLVTSAFTVSSPAVPDELRPYLSSCTNLAGHGWRVGQGLRTGANAFFYVDAVDRDRVRSALLPGEVLDVYPDLVAPVLRRQSELPDGYVVGAGDLRGRVLLLRSGPLPPDLARLVRLAATSPSPGHPRGTPIPALTAVAPNDRPHDDPPRRWYMLPPLTPRHVPTLLVPRVNGARPRAYLNRDGVVVDANFSTLWADGEDATDEQALLAVLNSTWVTALLESTASVLGAGALKVEATHLTRLPLPSPGPAYDRLARLGAALATGETQVLREINDVVARALAPAQPDALARGIARLAGTRREQRAGRVRGRTARS